jgi:hypothetical protein
MEERTTSRLAAMQQQRRSSSSESSSNGRSSSSDIKIRDLVCVAKKNGKEQEIEPREAIASLEPDSITIAVRSLDFTATSVQPSRSSPGNQNKRCSQNDISKIVAATEKGLAAPDRYHVAY